MKITPENKEGLRRLLWEADWTYQNFGFFRKYRIFTFRQFYKWQKFNHGCWMLYFKINRKKFNRIGRI
jgi:hypothetical protein